jgi:hypothetical protein
MAKGKKKKDRRKQARAFGAAGGLGAFAGTFAAKVLERLLVQHATRFIDHLGAGRRKSKKRDLGAAILLALCGHDGPVPVASLVAALNGDVLATVDAVHKMRRARLLSYAHGRRAVELTEHGREVLAAMGGPGQGRADDAGDRGTSGDDAGAKETAATSADGSPPADEAP